LLFTDYCEGYVVSSVVRSEWPTYNAALNRPAYQSSVFSSNRGSFSARLANDGSRETNALRGQIPRCSISLRENNPWWAADLGILTTVYRVDFTNRGDGSGM